MACCCYRAGKSTIAGKRDMGMTTHSYPVVKPGSSWAGTPSLHFFSREAVRTQDFRMDRVRCRTRRGGRVWGGAIPSHWSVPPPQKTFWYFLLKIPYFDSFCHANGSGSNPPTPPRHATAESGRVSKTTNAFLLKIHIKRRLAFHLMVSLCLKTLLM